MTAKGRTTEVTLIFTFQVEDSGSVGTLVKDMILLIPKSDLAIAGLQAKMEFRPGTGPDVKGNT